MVSIMKRWTDEHAAHVAKDFSRSDFAAAWHMFGRDIRAAIVDSLVMTEMRIADSVDSEIALTASDVVTFRALIETALAAGVKRRNAPPIRFEVSP